MFKSKYSGGVVTAGLMISLVFTAGLASGDELLKMVPANSLFCVRVNNFDYTLSRIDRFLAGVSPMPMGASMMARMQIAGALGDAALNNVNTGGSFAIFGVIMPGKSAATNPMADIFIGGLIPVTDFRKFVSDNPNCGQPDANGVSKITVTWIVKPVVTQVGNYALLSSSDNYDNLVAMAKSISNAKAAGLADTLDADEAQKAVKEPIWAYGNLQQASKVFASLVSARIEQMKMIMAQGPGVNLTAVMNMYVEILQTLMKETKSLSITVNPKPTVLNITKTIYAVPGTDMANMFTPDPRAQQENKLLGYLEDGAMMNFAGNMNMPFWKKFNDKFVDLLVAVAGQSMTAEDTANMKTLTADMMDSLAGPMACSLSIDPKTTPPFDITCAVAVADADKFNKVIEESSRMFNSGGAIAELCKNLGMEISFTLNPGVETYKGVSIDSAKLVIKAADANSPQAQMMNMMYGGGFDYRWAMVDGLWVCKIGGDMEAGIHQLIDTARAGGPKQIPAEIKSALQLLPDAPEAEFLATYNYLRVFKMAAALAPVPMPQFDIPTKSNINFAVKVENGKILIDIALPKEHLTEMMTAFQMMMQQKMLTPEQPTMQQMEEVKLLDMTNIVEPMVGIGGVRFGMTAEQMKEILGQPKSTTGHTYLYFDSGFVILATPDDTVDAIFCGDMSTSDAPLIGKFTYRTSKDIGMGSSKQQVISAYGQPSSIWNQPGVSNAVTLEYKRIGSKFTLINGRVVHMIFRMPR